MWQVSVNKYKELYKILHSMVQLCVTESALPNGTTKKSPRGNDQRLLRNMGVHNIVLDLTKISYEKTEDKRMRIIMRTAHQFLQHFCYSNAHNQALLHEKIDLTHYPCNEWEAVTATYIFKVCNFDEHVKILHNTTIKIELEIELEYTIIILYLCYINLSL